MIKLNLGTLRSETFKSALSKIYAHSDFPSLSIAFACLSKVKVIRKEIETADELHKTIVEKHAEKDKDGKPVVENNHYKIVDVKKFNADVLEFSLTEINLEVEKIKLDDLKGIKLSLAELESLESLLDA